jgi:hypothetical protein
MYTLLKFTHILPTTTLLVLIDSSTYGRYMSRPFISTLASERFHNRRQKENDQIGKNRIGHPAKDDLSGVYQLRSAMPPQAKKDKSFAIQRKT